MNSGSTVKPNQMELKDFTAKYTQDFKNLVDNIEASSAREKLSYSDGVAAAVEMIRKVEKENKKLIFVGNGGSAGIASHQAVDYWKNGGVRAIAFNDSSLLTCISNDYSYEEVFSVPIQKFADPGDIVFCISSSGSSKNILNAAKQAKESGCGVFTFSGFKQDNPLRSMGDVNFFIESLSYGFVEIIHLMIIHSILDAKLYCIDRKDVFNKNLSF